MIVSVIVTCVTATVTCPNCMLLARSLLATPSVQSELASCSNHGRSKGILSFKNSAACHWGPLFNGVGNLSRGYTGLSLKLTSLLRLLPRLRMSGTLSPLHLYAFMVWKGTALPCLPFTDINISLSTNTVSYMTVKNHRMVYPE